MMLKKKWTNAEILIGQITLDRAIKHLVNRAGVVKQDQHGVWRSDHPFTFRTTTDAVNIMDRLWYELKKEHTLNRARARRKNKKAGRA